MRYPADDSRSMDGARRYVPALAIFPSLLAIGSHLAARRAATRPTPLEVVEDVLATFFVTRAIAREKVGEPVRAPFVEPVDERDSPAAATGGDVQPAGHGMRLTVGELLTCTRCLGPWVALLVTFGRVFAPNHARTATHVAALGGANTLLHCWFANLQARTTPAAAAMPQEHTSSTGA